MLLFLVDAKAAIAIAKVLVGEGAGHCPKQTPNRLTPCALAAQGANRA